MPKLHAHFQNMLSARKAVEALKGMGYRDAHLDAAEKFLEEYSEEINFAGSRSAPSLSALIMRSNAHLFNIDKGPLMASDPMVSGIGCFKEISGSISTKLAVTVDDEKMEQIKTFLAESGGFVQ